MLKSLFPWKHNKTKRAMAVQQTMEEELILQEQNLVPCHVCGRTFLPNPLKKHEKVCEKNALKKRKPFDSLKQRVEGTELAAFHQKSYLKKTVEPQEQKRSRSSKWKEKHLELVTAIRAAKGIPNEMQSRSPKAKNTTLTERCPSCDRHFGPKAYDRHVEWCTERKARIQQSPASVQKAKEMLEARIKYRVPPLNKSKRARVREKYSTTPNDSETASVKSVGSNLSLLSTSFSRGPSVRKPKSLVNVSKVNDQKNVEKLDLERGSGDKVKQEHVKCVLPDIGTPGTKTELANSPTPNYDPFDVAQRQFMELLDSDNFKPFAPFNSQVTRPHTSNPNPIKTPTSPQVAPKTVKSADPIKKYNRASVIDPPSNFKDSLDSVNDDFELMENLINEHFNADDKNFHDNGYYLHNLKNDKRSLTLDHILDNRKYSDDASSIDPCLINENDNLSIPDHFKVDDYSPTYTEITVQNDDVDQYSVQYDAKIEAIEPKIAKKPIVKRSVSLVSRSKKDTNAVGKVSVKKPSLECKKSSKSVCSVDRGEKTKTLPLLKRSITLFDPSSPKTSFKNKKQVNELSEEREQKCTKKTGHHNARSTPKKADTPILDAFKAEELFAVDDEMYEEYKKFEEMYLKEKEQKANPRRNKKGLDLNCGLFAPSTEESETPNVNGKISYDSAYGSLTRKTTRHKSRSTKLTPLDQKQAESGSSSSSENGPNSPLVVSDVSKVSKFCHECGTRFPVSTAKFCVECGIRRLVL
ncbi:uncharacterized protein LOC132698919 isoform X4 [Cylas formicarius]|uniref:uncharacterized protein LOC132698919 isoform X4 n=1 Tax=Cylas formicarius TaxID=197179 RepID=UPI00295832EA|nr:uncharacterized protein LOC132698919 isoform X4 [Cylas formicarius]